MVDLRTALAAVLGIGLGALLIAFPEVAIRAHTAGRLPHDRGGKYGKESSPPDRWLLVVRALGVVVFLGGVYFGASALAVV